MFSTSKNFQMTYNICSYCKFLQKRLSFSLKHFWFLDFFEIFNPHKMNLKCKITLKLPQFLLDWFQVLWTICLKFAFAEFDSFARYI